MNGENMKGTKAIVLALAAALFFKIFVFDFAAASGSSMEPAVHSGDVLVISRLSYGFRLPLRQGYIIRWLPPKTGEVVVFYTPFGDRAVKRVAKVNGKTFFAQGDNADASFDSSSYGPVSIDSIIGKVLFVPSR